MFLQTKLIKMYLNTISLSYKILDIKKYIYNFN